jgi:hypothetical protein
MKMFSQYKLTKELILLLFTFGVTSLLLYFAFPDYYHTLDVQAQLPQQQSPSIIDIKIISPGTGQQVPVGLLRISGTSTDNASTDCTVYADWNNTKPSQKAIATGPGGVNDYSTWTFTYTPEYHVITEGTNNLTSKLSCVDGSNSGNLTKSYSVKVIGIGGSFEGGTTTGTSGSTAGSTSTGTTDSTAGSARGGTSTGTTDSTAGSARGGTSTGTTDSTAGSARGGTSTGTTGATSGSARGDIIESPRGDTSRGTTGSIASSR